MDRNPYPNLDPSIGDSDEGYCPQCGSCGEPGCCHPTGCVAVKCFYGIESVVQYRKSVNDAANWHDCLRIMGIDEPWDLTPERAARFKVVPR